MMLGTQAPSYQTARCHSQDSHSLNLHRLDNFKRYVIRQMWNTMWRNIGGWTGGWTLSNNLCQSAVTFVLFIFVYVKFGCFVLLF